MVGILRRPLLIAVAAALAVTSCTSGDEVDSVASTQASAPPVLTDEECLAAALDAIVPVQEFVDTYDSMTVDEWNALDPPPDLEGPQADAVAIAQAAVDDGCDPEVMSQRLADALDEIEGRGEVGRAIAAAIRGDGPLYGPPEVVIPTTAPRNQVPTTVRLRPGESLGDLLAGLAPGSTVEFAAGTHTFSEPIVVEIDLNFVGAGEQETILSSEAAGVALAFVGPGGFTLRDLTLEHEGDAGASVFLAIEGPVTIENATIRGGVADDAGAGGHGVVFAYENLDGFPVRTDSERGGLVTMASTTVTGNDAAGVLVTGTAAPSITDSSITDNGSCGICYTGTAAGTVIDATIESNGVGVQVEDEARPALTGSRIRRNSGLGASASGDATLTISESVVEENGDIGIQVLDNARAVVERNTVRLHSVGMLVEGTASAVIDDNGVVDHDVGIQVAGLAVVETIDNAVWLTSIAAISYGDDSSGTVTGNRVDRAAGVAIQSVGAANTDVNGNRVENQGAVGISYIDESSGGATGNEIVGREVGIQVGGTATPDLVDNEILDSLSVGILYSGGAAGSAATNLVRSAEAVGIDVGGASSPRLEDNDITGNTVGMVFRASTQATARRNTIDLNDIGVQVADRARATIEANTIRNSVEAGALFGGSASGSFELNTLVANGDTAVQIGEQAHTRFDSNEIRGAGTVAVVFLGTADSEFRANRIIDFAVGIQVSGAAVPQIYDNTFEAVDVTDIAYRDESGGEVAGNTCTAATPGTGIRVAPTANPNLGENDCTVSAG